MHRLVTEDARGRLGKIAVGKQGDGTEVCADSPLFELCGESEHIGLCLELRNRKLVFRLGSGRLAAEFSTVFASTSMCCL
jgi:hypothetical protein